MTWKGTEPEATPRYGDSAGCDAENGALGKNTFIHDTLNRSRAQRILIFERSSDKVRSLRYVEKVETYSYDWAFYSAQNMEN